MDATLILIDSELARALRPAFRMDQHCLTRADLVRPSAAQAAVVLTKPLRLITAPFAGEVRATVGRLGVTDVDADGILETLC
jgi:hypothetical protein